MMARKHKLGFNVLLSLFLVFIILNFSERKAEATDVVLPTSYYFVFNGQQKEAGAECEMTMQDVLLNVTSGSWEPSTTVQWVSSEPNVVSLQTSSAGSNFINLHRVAPGYSTITAVIKQGTYSYTMSCLVKVALAFDYQKTGMDTITTTKERVLIIENVGEVKEIFLKYVDYTTDKGSTAVSGAAISASIATWESDNPGVASFLPDKPGEVKAEGAGSATITVTSNTMSSTDKPMTITMKVVVVPRFSISYDNPSGSHVTANSYEDNDDPLAVAKDLPSSFVVESNAKLGTNLKWKVIDFSTGKELPAGKSAKMTYTVSTISGNVSFTGVKAGTYEIYAFADEDYSVDTKVPYAYLKVIVPIYLGNINLVMGVNDTYNLIENTNITGIGIFGEPEYLIGTQNDVFFDTSNYVIKARRKSNVSIRLIYNSSLDLYDTNYTVPPFTINITVIDGIALSITNANLYTLGTLKLDAKVTDPTEPITWTSSNPEVASVVDGLVTAGKIKGSTTITASQTINGVVKKATCNITVQLTVTNIVVTPTQTTLAINAFTTLHATITPSDLSNINLQWKSSNENVVKVVEASALTATIQGIAGGNAVISAINQDNVVVGYCHVSVQQPVDSITLSETSGVVKLTSRRLQLRATVSPENALNKTVTWTSTNTSLATVNDNGLVTLLKPGTVTIIATSQDNPRATAMCNLTIEVPVVSVTLDETAKTLYIGQTARLGYQVQPVNASNNLVSWSSTNNTVATVDNTGLVTAKNVGSTVIILKTSEGGYSVLCSITVKSVATAVKLDVTALDLKVNEIYFIKTTLTPKDATETALKWESSDTKVAVVDGAGKVVAKSAGSAIIMVKTVSGGVAYCKVTVRMPVSGIILNFSEKTIYTGMKFSMKASISPSGASNLGVIWKSSNEKVATITSSGEVTALKGGVAIITGTTVDGNFTAPCVVTVKEIVTSIKLDYDTYNLGINKTFKLTATVSNETATNQKVMWTTSNDGVATVNQNGKVTGIAAGYATITATAMDGSDVEATCEVRIVTPVESIVLNDNYITLYTGDAKTLKATIRPKNSTFKTAIWTSSDTSVAIVDSDGVVTALKAGTAMITAETQDNNGKKAICTVAVYDRLPATGITLQDKKLTMVSGETKVVQLVLIPAASTDKYTWSTDNPAVAKVDKVSGKITAKSPGTAYVTVMTDSGKTATVEVTVIGLNISQLVTEEYTTYNNILSVEGATGTVSFRIDNPMIAVVYSNGTVSTRGVGSAIITATVNGRKLTCKLTVKKQP